MLLLVACGDSQPLPDIDATVEARVEVAKAALVVPTAAPLPTYTPLPTFAPAPIPTQPVMGSATAVRIIFRRFSLGY